MNSYDGPHNGEPHASMRRMHRAEVYRMPGHGPVAVSIVFRYSARQGEKPLDVLPDQRSVVVAADGPAELDRGVDSVKKAIALKELGRYDLVYSRKLR